MKTLYLECQMGAAGDMLMAALLELHREPAEFIRRLNGLGIPHVQIEAEPSVKCGIKGTHMRVRVQGAEEHSHDVQHDEHHAHHEHGHGHEHGAQGHEHHHIGRAEIGHIVEQLSLPEAVKTHVLAVYDLIAEAESHAHGKSVEEIHFHEVGTMDALADIVGVCWLMEELAVESVLASPIHVGSGMVRCAHGVLPVPAPATAYILQGIPTYSSEVKGELCTPTGAALLKHFVSEFLPMPVLTIEAIGYGMGSKDFAWANCVRALLGETAEQREAIIELCCNLDDMTPEAIGFATEELLQQGAVEVYTTAIQMKKNRPGVLLSCMCRQADRDHLLQQIFRHTTTLGIREYTSQRYTLEREMSTIATRYGDVRIKRSAGWGVQRDKLEYEDIAAIARSSGCSLAEATELVRSNEA